MSIRARVQRVFLELRHKRRRYRVLNHITLSRANTLANVQLMQRKHPGCGIVPVLKANAYGHGLKEMAEILNGADIELLAVDGYFEAGKIRFITRHQVLVLGYILPENVPVLDTKRCSFVVQDLQVLEAFGKLHRPVRIHLELNTGMNRLGIARRELHAYLAMFHHYPQLVLEGVMTHLADADNVTSYAYTAMQVRAFDDCMEEIVLAGFEPRMVHIAQTAGSMKVQSVYANTIRLGIGLYGINPLLPQDECYAELQDLRPVLELTSTLIKTLTLHAGDKVSYSGTFVAPREMRIGVLPLGYYEGIPRQLSNAGIITHDGSTLPIVGRVCMNHTMVDLGNTNLSVGDTVMVLSDNPAMPNSVAQVCANQEIFPYVLLVKLSSSIRRRIV